MSKKRDKDLYLKQYPRAQKWLNQCAVCGTVGYKPELPEKITPGYLAENLRAYFTPLQVNEISMCNECAEHWNAR
jgi:hypothetical protein